MAVGGVKRGFLPRCARPCWPVRTSAFTSTVTIGRPFQAPPGAICGTKNAGQFITMQLAGLLDEDWRNAAGRRSPGQNWARAVAATRLERSWRKDDILEAYLNPGPFGASWSAWMPEPHPCLAKPRMD